MQVLGCLLLHEGLALTLSSLHAAQYSILLLDLWCGTSIRRNINGFGVMPTHLLPQHCQEGLFSDDSGGVGRRLGKYLIPLVLGKQELPVEGYVEAVLCAWLSHLLLRLFCYSLLLILDFGPAFNFGGVEAAEVVDWQTQVGMILLYLLPLNKAHFEVNGAYFAFDGVGELRKVLNGFEGLEVVGKGFGITQRRRNPVS